jgi:hypothetical protein
MTYTCSIWDYALDAQLLKFQRLQIRVLCATSNLDRCTPVRELHVAFKIPYVYVYTTKLCRTQGEVILNHVISSVRGIGQREARGRKYTRKYCVFELCPSSYTLKTRQDNVSETLSVSILR